jgi:hypothetical protein
LDLVTLPNFIRDDQDINALAVEIAPLTRRQQRGRGRGWHEYVDALYLSMLY